MNTDEKTSVPTALYVLGGIAIGAALGLLFAPKKGSELREDIDELGRNAGEKGRALYAKAQDMLPNRVKAAAIIGAVNGAGHEVLSDVKERLATSVRS